MVARITVSKSIHGTLQYNEQKVRKGVARCLYAHHFLKEAADLSFGEKLDRFKRLIALNKRATANTVHISLNFGVEEKLSEERLAHIARGYMERLGFGQQPYLVYQHHDAGHPHVHIVTTNICSDGKRISLHNIGRNQSERARKEIEIIFGLKPAQAAAEKVLAPSDPLDVQRVAYGKVATKGGIEKVLAAVLPRYKYTSLAELNAVLKRYNVMADGGTKESALRRQRGLLYRALDDQGHPVGVPIKASAILGKPTLDYLEGQFAKNAVLRQPFIKGLKSRLDWILARPLASLDAFEQALRKEKISLAICKNEEGMVTDLTYVDHNTCCVFTGRDIGKVYNAEPILKKGHNIPLNVDAYPSVSPTQAAHKRQEEIEGERGQKVDILGSLKEVVAPAEEELPAPHVLRKKRRRKPRA
jgi:Relaxase/Mobilisation nuclease domain